MTNRHSVTMRCVVRVLLFTVCLLPTRAVGDVSAVVESVERLPRTKRLAAYEAALVRPGISEADRVVLIRAFSQHAKRLSPLHGPTSYRFDPSRWFAILNYGFKADPADADIMWALGKLLIDWARLNNRGQNPGAHEMGHAFGLEHVGVPGATMATETNIMSSVGEGFGSGGKRNLGFTEAQAAVILHHAKRTYQRLGLSESQP